MAAHRYWRVVALEAYGAGDLELSCFHLLDATSTRVDAPATLTASAAPATGAVANLKDDDLTTAVRWSMQSVASLSVSWDFGVSPVDVACPQLSGDDLLRFPYTGFMQFSDDGVGWVTILSLFRLSWPGPLTKTVQLAANVWSRTDSHPSNTVDATGKIVTSNTISGFTRGVGVAVQGVRQFEIVVGGVNAAYFGVASKVGSVLANGIFQTATAWSYSPSEVLKLNNSVASAYGGSIAPLGTVIGVVVNFNTGELTFYRAGVSLGVAFMLPLNLELYPAFGAGNSSSLTGTLRTSGFTYPIAGAEPWTGDVTISRSGVRTQLAHPVTMGTSPTITYGTPLLTEINTLTVQSGAIKDYTSGVMGTGRGRINGTVKEKGTPSAPVYRKVRLFRDSDGLLMRELWSHPTTGAYSFDYIDELQKFTVISYDHLRNYRAVIADNLIPELMP